MSKSLSRKLVDKPYILWSVLFIIAPLIMVFYYAFTDTTGAFSFSSIKAIPAYTSTVLLSVIYGVIASAICLLIGYPFAYLLTKTKLSTQSMMVLLVMLPMWMNFLIRTYSWMTILGDSGIVNTALGAIGLGSAKLINTGGAVVLGMIYNFLPYMILPIYSVISKMDNSLIEAAQDLGSTKAQIFRKVIMPLSLPGVISGITMVFVPCVSTFYITQKLGGGQVVLIGDIIETQFQTANNYHLGASLSLVLMVLIILCLGIMNFIGADEESEGGVII